MKQADSVSFARVLARREVLALSFGAMIGFSWVILTDNWILEAGTGGAVPGLCPGWYRYLIHRSGILGAGRRHAAGGRGARLQLSGNG